MVTTLAVRVGDCAEAEGAGYLVGGAGGGGPIKIDVVLDITGAGSTLGARGRDDRDALRAGERHQGGQFA